VVGGQLGGWEVWKMPAPLGYECMNECLPLRGMDACPSGEKSEVRDRKSAYSKQLAVARGQRSEISVQQPARLWRGSVVSASASLSTSSSKLFSKFEINEH